jgi:hypothetical protein
MSRKALSLLFGLWFLGFPRPLIEESFKIPKSQPLSDSPCLCENQNMQKYFEPWLSLKSFRTLIRLSAGTNNVDAELLAALLLHESSGKIHASRFEPGFFKRYIDGVSEEKLRGHWPKWSKDSSGNLKERLDRSTSWGLGQIMGQTARENGFSANYLCELCDPEINIPFAAQFLARKFRQAADLGFSQQELRKQALLRYNGGGDLGYPDRVFKELENARRIFHE